MTRYTVTAQRSGRWWALQCVEVPGALSQVARLDQAPDAMREAIAFVAEVDLATIDVEVLPELPIAVDVHRRAAARLRDESDVARSAAAIEIRPAARALADEGLSMRDIGTVLGVSHQRAHQLIHDLGAVPA